MRVNNKYRRFLYSGALLSLCSLLFMACPTIPEFPDSPRIEYEDVAYERKTITTESGVQITSDVIYFTIYFEDGDGDLGLNSDNTDFPYNDYFVPVQDNNELIRIGDSDTLPDYNPLEYLTPSDEDSLYYVYIRYENTDSAEYITELLGDGDTIFIIPNPRSKNIFIDTYYQPNPNADFVKFDWEAAPYYQSLNGRFPELNTEEYDRPLNGRLTYELESVSFSSIFRADPIIIECYILDRAGNKSNTIRSEPFVLSEVQINGN